MRIVLLGSGNVATHLAKGLTAKHEILQIYSHTLTHAQTLAKEIGCEHVTDDMADIMTDADVYIVSVKDDVLPKLAANTLAPDAIWIHTAGSVKMEVFENYKNRYGVLYPMQSFSKYVAVNWKEVPIFVEGSDAETLAAITDLGRDLSENVGFADSTMRKRLHIAAVFSCNFVNHLWVLADDVLQEGGLKFDSMLPLIRSTVDKLSKVSPKDSQTGPAVREDYAVMQSHLDILGDGEKSRLYKALSESIIETKHRNI